MKTTCGFHFECHRITTASASVTVCGIVQVSLGFRNAEPCLLPWWSFTDAPSRYGCVLRVLQLSTATARASELLVTPAARLHVTL